MKRDWNGEGWHRVGSRENGSKYIGRHTGNLPLVITAMHLKTKFNSFF